MARLTRRYWKLAVITLEEDFALNAIAKNGPFNAPDLRWAAAGIKFPRERGVKRQRRRAG
jgi:hypothetical protein